MQNPQPQSYVYCLYANMESEIIFSNILWQVGALPDQFPVAWQVWVLSPTRL